MQRTLNIINTLGNVQLHKSIILAFSLFAVASFGEAAEVTQPKRIGLTTTIVKKNLANSKSFAAEKFTAPTANKQFKAKGFGSTAQLVNALLGFEDSAGIVAAKVRINKSR